MQPPSKNFKFTPPFLSNRLILQQHRFCLRIVLTPRLHFFMLYWGDLAINTVILRDKIHENVGSTYHKLSNEKGKNWRAEPFLTLIVQILANLVSRFI